MSDQATVSASLQDIHDIRMLKHRYAALADVCCSPDGAKPAVELAALFTDDGVWEAPAEHGGRHVGRQAIAAFFAGLGKSVTWGSHLMTNDQIALAGDNATGAWKNIVPMTALVDGKPTAFWIFGGYRDVYVKKGGRWLFKELNAYVDRVARHDQGWA